MTSGTYVYSRGTDDLFTVRSQSGYRIRKNGQESKGEQKRTGCKVAGQGEKRVFYLLPSTLHCRQRKENERAMKSL